MQSLSFTGACKHFFGMQEGQTLTGFRDEVKQLSPKDRAEIKQGLEATGLYQIKDEPVLETALADLSQRFGLGDLVSE